MNEATIRRILSQYGYTEPKLFAVEKGYRNENHPFQLADGQRLNFIIYKREPHSLATVQRANKAGNFAAGRGLPARQTADTRIMALRSGNWCRYGALYHYLPGHTIPWEAYTKDHLKLLGKALAELHRALQPLSATSYPQASEYYLQLLEHIEAYFHQEGVQMAMHAKLGLRIPSKTYGRLKPILAATGHLHQQQALHMDFVRSNILFDGETDSLRVSGILDFEKALFGHRLFDIARTLAFLLVDCKYKTTTQIRKYFLYSGYQKRGGEVLPRITIQTAREKVTLLEPLVGFFLLYDFYKFLRHNPYESLAANDHYRRTVELLHHREMLQ